MNEIQQTLLGESPLLITDWGYRQLLVAAFGHPLPAGKLNTPTVVASIFDRQTYSQQCRKALDLLCASLPPAQESRRPSLTTDFTSVELAECSIAYHRVFGPILSDSRWLFSSKDLEANLKAAEANPSIAAHLLHVNSPGGEAWYLDRLGQTFDACLKPIVCIYEQACSAAYHIACHAARIYATTQFDFVGCIGTMTSFYDYEAYFAQMGLKRIDAKADQSDLKNKMFDDLRNGKPRQFVQRVLNPMNDDFLHCVRSHRSKLASLPDDAPVLRGETYYTAEAIDVGLADGMATFAEAVAKADTLGRQWADSNILKALNS